VAEEEARVLLDEILAQAAAERERILSEGRARAAAIRASGEAEIRRLESEALHQLERRLAVDEDRILGESRLEARTGLLTVRREWIDRAFQLAGRRLAERCASPGYEGLLASLMREAAEALGGEGELRVAEADLELARGVVSRLGLPHEVQAEGGEQGTVIAVSSGRRVDNSLTTRLQEASRSLEREVAGLLFVEPDVQPGRDG
jgi:vacuolar-type H+-ATPase subunit E/Vma4